MSAALAEVKEEWRRFRDDSPGERFRKHRERMKRKSKKHAAVATALGVLLLVSGVVLLFMPGPGLLLIVFGLALVGSHVKRVADAMDRAEPALRDRGRRIARWWRHLSRGSKAGVVVAGAAVTTLALVGTWRFVIAAYLL
jgi:hypothetical protein